MNRSSFLSMILVLSFLAFSCSDRKTTGYHHTLLSGPWQLQSADSAGAGGDVISRSDYHADGWYTATVPTTVLHALVENGVFTDIFRDDHLGNIPQEPFRSP